MYQIYTLHPYQSNNHNQFYLMSIYLCSKIIKCSRPLHSLYMHRISLHLQHNGYKSLIILRIYIKNSYKGFFYIGTKRLHLAINISRSSSNSIKSIKTGIYSVTRETISGLNLLFILISIDWLNCHQMSIFKGFESYYWDRPKLITI